MSLKDKDLISIHDLSVGEVATILDVAKKLKRKQKAGEPHQYLKGKTLAMLFSKASTRTRTSFEVGFWQLGGHPIYLSDSASQIGRGEPIRDTARVLSRFVDGIMKRSRYQRPDRPAASLPGSDRYLHYSGEDEGSQRP